MLIAAFIFLTIAILMGLYLDKGTDPTLLLIAKIILYFSVAIFLILLITDLFNSAPPVPEGKNNLPI